MELRGKALVLPQVHETPASSAVDLLSPDVLSRAGLIGTPRPDPVFDKLLSDQLEDDLKFRQLPLLPAPPGNVAMMPVVEPAWLPVQEVESESGSVLVSVADAEEDAARVPGEFSYELEFPEFADSTVGKPRKGFLKSFNSLIGTLLRLFILAPLLWFFGRK